MAGNQRDEKIRYVFDTDGAEKLGAIEKTLGDITEKSLGTETAFSFIKSHLEELTVAALALSAAFKAIDFGKEGLKNAEDVEASLSRVQALAKDVADQFGDMGDAVEKAAQDVNVSTGEAASGLAGLVSTGLAAHDAIAALVPTLQLAKIANIDVGQAADIVGKALAAFGLPAKDAQEVVDRLTVASHGSAGGLAAMSLAATTLAPDAKQLGLSFDQVVSVLGLLSIKGLDSEKAMRGMRTVFQELENPTSKLRQELLALGDGGNDFGKAVAALTSGTPRANEALLSLNGASRSLIIALGQAGPDALAKFQAALADSSGAADRTAGILDNNLRGASTRFGNAIEQIGEKLAKPVLTPFTEELNKLAGELNKFADSPDFKDIQAQVGEMAKQAATALDKFLHGIDWKNFIADAEDAFKQLTEGLKGVAENVEAVTAAIGKAMDGLGLVYHGAAVAIDGAVHIAAKGIDNLADAVTGGASSMTEFHNVMSGVADEAGNQFSENLHKAGANLESLAGSSEKAAEGTKKHEQAATEAAPAIIKQGDASKQSAAAVDDLEKSLQTVQPPAQQAAQGVGEFTQSLRDAIEKGRAVADSMADIAGAFKTLHVTSQQELQKTATDAANAFGVIDKASAQTATGLADRQAAFLAYAKAALAASAGLDEGAKSSTRYELESKAAALGLDDALQKLEGQAPKTGAALSRMGQQAANSLQNTGAAAKDAGDNVKDMAGGGGESLAQLDNALQNTRQGFLNVSDAAAKAFDAHLLSDWNLAFDSTGANIGKTVDAMNNAARNTTADITSQRNALNNLIAGYNEMGNESVADFLKTGKSAAQATGELDATIASIKNGTYNMGLLGKQDMAGLLSALEAAKQRTDALAQAAEQAKQRFLDLAQQAHDALLQEEGDQAGLEDSRHQKALENLEEEAKATGQLNSAAYAQAVADENRLHDLKMQHLAEQQKQQGGSQGGASKQSQSNGQSSSSGNGASNSGAGSGSSAAADYGASASAAIPVAINHNGRTINIVAGTAAEADAFENFLQEIVQQRNNSIHRQ